MHRHLCCWLVTARKQATSGEILLWMTPSETPKALQASECSELLDPARANCWISAQHQPGKFNVGNLHVAPETNLINIEPVVEKSEVLSSSKHLPAAHGELYYITMHVIFVCRPVHVPGGRHHSVHFIANQSFACY